MFMQENVWETHVSWSTVENRTVFFLSKLTYAGGEIGWDFISMVKSARISFTGFCNELTRKYRTNNIFSAPFMSVDTFVKWIFAWMGSINIDFRKEIDPWCEYNPRFWPVMAPM